MLRVRSIVGVGLLAAHCLACESHDEGAVSAPGFAAPFEGSGPLAVPEMSPEQVRCVPPPGPGDGIHYESMAPTRRDITEGQAGAAIKLVLRVVRARGCSPISYARVAIWQANAEGQYSGPDIGDAGAQGSSYLRGAQLTDDTGTVVFETIFPGWTDARAPRVHVKLEAPGGSSLSAQEVFFTQELAARVYAEPPYAARGPAPIDAAQDPWQADPAAAVAEVAESGQDLIAEARLTWDFN